VHTRESSVGGGRALADTLNRNRTCQGDPPNECPSAREVRFSSDLLVYTSDDWNSIKETSERNQHRKVGSELLKDGLAINLVERVGQIHLHDQ
jgi:hypothetical protein